MRCPRKAHGARDRIADEESEARLAIVRHKDAVLAQDEHRVGGDDFARSLSNLGEHLVCRPVWTQDDHFAVPISDDRASIREESAGLDELEDVVAGVGAVAVDGFRGEVEGCGDGWSALVRDDPHAGAVGDLDLGVAGGFGVAAAGEEGCGQDQGEVGSGLHLPLDTDEIDGVYRYLGARAKPNPPL